MSDSGIPSSSGPPAAPARLLPGKDDQPARIEDIGDALKILSRPVRLEGQVIAHNSDGSVRIQTDQGDIDVRLRGNGDLTDGEIVQIDIAAGRPPRQAVIRPDPGTTQESSTPPAPDDTNPGSSSLSPSPLPSPLPSRGIPTPPVPPLAVQSEKAPPAPPKTALLPGDIVRLLPLPPQKAAQISVPAASTLPVIESVVTHIAAETIFKSVVIAAAVSASEQAPEIFSAALPTQTKALDTGKTPPSGPLRIPPLPGILLPAPPLTILTGAHDPRDPLLPAPLRLLAEQVTLFPRQITQEKMQPFPSSFPLHLTAPEIKSSALAAPIPSLIRSRIPTPAALSLLPIKIFAKDAPALPVPEKENSLQPRRVSFLDVRIISAVPEPVKIAAPLQEAAIPAPSSPFHELPPGPAGSLTVKIVGFTAGNEKLPVVAVGNPAQPGRDTLFVLQSGASDLRAGDMLIVMPHHLAAAVPYQPVAAAPELSPSFTPAYELLGTPLWPAMNALPQTLSQITGETQAAALQTLTHAAPNPATPQQMPAAAMFFLAAVRAGDIAGWLGEKTLGILRDTGHDDIIDRLGRDAAGLQKTDAPQQASGGQDWRAMALPLFWENELHKMILYYRRSGDDSGGEQEKKSKQGSRFVFELNLNRMGRIQLDGLHRPPGRLDLIVRTGATLSHDMKQAMRGVWLRALEQTDLAGEISFQHKPEQFVKIETSRQQTGISA